MSMPERPVTLRSIAVVAFLPSALYSVCSGAITPIIPLTATGLGASTAMAAVIVAMMGLGKLLADTPAGSLTARFGERVAMIGAGIFCAAAVTVAMTTKSLPVFAASILAIGMGTAVWMLARQTFVAEIVPFALRARAMSTLGGVQRVGMFIGPFMGAGLTQVLGARGAYVAGLAAVLVATLVLILVTDPAADKPGAAKRPPTNYVQLLRSERSVLATLGIGMLLIAIVRTSRQAVIPLWGEHIGLSPTTISLIYGASGAVEVLLFYPAGRIMDLHGRAPVAVASMVGLAVGHILLPTTETVSTLVIVAILMGIGNGLGAGLGLTIAADVSPPDHRPVFFGIWRVITDIGNTGGPLILAGITSALWLGAGVLSIGGIGILAAVAMGYWIPRRAKPRDQ